MRGVNLKRADKQNREKLSGVVERITFHNQQNGWSVLKVSSFRELEDLSTVIIHQEQVYAGTTMDFWGEWINHPKYGRQFKATQCIEKKPASAAALEKYLGSGLIKGVGPVTARRIVSFFKSRTLEVFENSIGELTSVPGIAQKKLEQIRDSWDKHKAIREVMVFLQNYGISTLFATKIYKTYRDQSIQKVSENPYCLAQDIFGIGFFSADRVALAMGFLKDGEPRIKAGVMHVLASSREEGHCYLTQTQIVEKTLGLLQEDISSESISEVLRTLLLDNQIRLRKLQSRKSQSFDIHTEDCYYSKTLYYDELSTSEIICDLLKNKILLNSKQNSKKVELWTLKYCEKNHIKLSDEQEEAVCKIPSETFSVLTGGPGCGKTTCTKVLVELLKAMGRKVTLAAPTGRAAQRMSEVIGAEAKTIHRLLEWLPQTNRFHHNEENPIETDFLIVDEVSMLDISLSANLLKAVPKEAQVLFIGDPDQLPSVGAGSVLADLLNSDSVPRFCLTKVFRQAQESHIIKFAHQINMGETPKVQSAIKTPNAFEKGVDCLFFDSDEVTQDQLKSIQLNLNKLNLPESESEKSIHPWSSLRYGLTAVDTVRRLYTKTIYKWFGRNDVEMQVLCPQNRGSMGTMNLNLALQKASNPESERKKEIQIGGKTLRQYDRVIQTKNNYDLGVFNGDIGKIIDIDTEEFCCSIQFSSGDRRIVNFTKEQIGELQLAYAITIHKSQGSEFEVVIIPVLGQHHKMLFRNLIYTGLTRAKKLALFVGTRKAFALSINQIDNRKRQTALANLIEKSLG